MFALFYGIKEYRQAKQLNILNTLLACLSVMVFAEAYLYLNIYLLLKGG